MLRNEALNCVPVRFEEFPMRIRSTPCCARLNSHIRMICSRPLGRLQRSRRRGVLLVWLAAFSWIGCDKKETAVVAAPEVEVTPVTQQDVPLYTECIATLDGYVNAQIQPQVSGYLMKQTYREGTIVHKGAVLFEIDPRPFEAALQQAQGQQAQAEAQLGKTALDVQRDTPLAKQSAIPQAQLDNDIQANAAASAVLKANKAQVEQARLNLGFTKVRSLVDGIAGIAKGQIGDLVGPTTILTTVSQVQPIKAYFSVSEQEYLPYAARISEVVSGKRVAGTNKALELILADGSVYPHK